MVKLRMDMPESCKDCRLKYRDRFGLWWCCPEESKHSALEVSREVKARDRSPICPLIKDDLRIGEWLPVHEDLKYTVKCSRCGALWFFTTEFCPDCGSFNGKEQR